MSEKLVLSDGRVLERHEDVGCWWFSLDQDPIGVRDMFRALTAEVRAREKAEGEAKRLKKALREIVATNYTFPATPRVVQNAIASLLADEDAR